MKSDENTGFIPL